MIQAHFAGKAVDQITGFTLSGHADSGDYGHDIVCAAVSAVAIGTVNGIEALSGATPNVQADEVNGGHLALQLLPNMTADQQATAQLLLHNLYLELQSIAAEYGDYLIVTQPK